MLIAPIQGLAQPTPDFSFLKHEGGSGLTTWVSSPWIPGGITTRVATIGTILGVLLPVGRRYPVRGINFAVTVAGGAGSLARAGIYRVKSGSDLHPGTLIVDGGEKATDVITQKTTDPFPGGAVFLEQPGVWLVILAGVSAPTIQAIVVQQHPALGNATPGNSLPQYVFEAAQAYGPLPATAPAGTLQANPAPFIQVRPGT